jgi:hypothetical protein
MLTLSEVQWHELLANDVDQFVAAVRDQFLATRPDMKINPGPEAVLGRMRDARDYAVRNGFISTPHIVHMMCLAADAPRFYADPPTDAYLRKRGATREQRFDDLIAVIAEQNERER